MNILKTLAITATLFISCNQLSAQKKDETAKVEKDWYIKESLPLSETQKLGIYEHKGWDNGVVLINNKCGVEWELPIKGCAMAVGKHRGNYLVFYSKKGYWTKEYGSYNAIEQLNAATIDAQTHKIIDDKVVYSGKNYIVPYFQNDPAGNFSQLLVRETSKDDLEITASFKLISFNADGSVATKAITSIAATGLFVGSSGGKDGSFFIISIQNGSAVVVEKFSHDGSFITKQSSPLSILKKSEYKALVLTDTCTNNAVFLTLLYVNQEKAKTYSHFRFNFDNNQVAARNEEPLNKISTYGNVDQAQYLLPIDAFFTKDNVIVVRMVKHTDDYSTTSRRDVRYWGASVIVSIFDKEMKLQRDVLINKTIMSYNWRDPEITAHLNKDRLYILGVESTSTKADIGNFCYNINLNDGKFEKKAIGSPNPSSTSMYAPASLWFGNEFILTHLHVTLFGKSNSVLERVGYDML